VSRPGDAADAGQNRAPAGLLEKLMSAVRPEFRGAVIPVDPADPVFGGPPCQVDGWITPGILEAMKPGRMRGHGSTAEIPG
jgi:hypothetical protein